MKGCELKKCTDWNGEKCTYPGLFCKYDQADDYPEDAPLAPDGCVIFEGVTKEAHDKLKEQNALLASEVERLGVDYNELIMAVSKKFPGETRHQTALRYIVERESRQDNNPKQQLARREVGGDG